MSYLDIARRVLNEKTREHKNLTKETKKVPVATATTEPPAAVGNRDKAAPPTAVPPEWTAGLARLWRMPAPACVRPERRWKQVLADTDRFIDRWGAQAAALGWTTLDVFGADRTHPIERIDQAGLVLLLHGDELVALTADAGRIRTRSGALLTHCRRALTPAVPLWELGGGKP